MTAELFVDIGLVSGILLCVLIALGQMLMEKKDRKNYLLIATVLLIAVYQFSISFYLFSGLKHWYSLFPYVYVGGKFSLYAAIPMTYLFFRALPEKDFVFTPKALLHLIIPAAAAVILIVFGSFPENPGGDPRHYKDFLHDTLPVFHIVSVASSIMAIVYFTLVILFYINLYRRSKVELKKNLTVIIIFLLIPIFVLIAYIFFDNSIEALYNVIKLRFTLLTIYLFLLSYRYPFLMNIIKLEAYREYYLNSRLKDVEADKIIDSLEELMEEEKLYTDTGLNIKKVSGRLGIPAIKLSEVLNTRQYKTFSTYINEKRISYASELLKTEQEMTVLEIALDSGFNTISNFNATFKRLIGKTPTQYRKMNTGVTVK